MAERGGDMARQHTSFSREGWYYVFVLAFVLGGAVLREVNLLILLAGLMVGPLLFNWRLVVATLRDLHLRRVCPPSVGAGEPFSVEVVIENRRMRLGSWALVIEDRLRRVDDSESDDDVAVTLFASQVPADSEQSLRYRCVLARRGRYEFDRTTLSTRFPFGFIRRATFHQVPGKLVVCPRLGQLQPAWRRMIEPRRIGTQQSSRHRGRTEGNYFGLRDWQQGDSQRWIHWRTTAKRGQLSVLEFEQHRDMELALVVDLWQPQAATDQQRGCVELAISFLGTVVADLCRQGGNRLLINVVGSQLHSWQGTSSQIFLHDVLENLADVQGSATASFPPSLATTLADWGRAPRVIVISTRPRNANLLASLTTQFGQRVSATEAQQQIEWIDVSSNQLENFFHV